MRRVIPALAVLIFIGGVTYVSINFFHVGTTTTALNQMNQAAAVELPYMVPPLTQDYKNTDYNFELNMPADFKAAESPPDENGARTITLQDSTDNGIQIAVTPFDEDITNLTEDRIHQDQPDLTITDPQPVQIGESDTGLAFKSDNQAFDGASREVWFVFRGNLYQISTYDRLDPLLKSIFTTWKFL